MFATILISIIAGALASYLVPLTVKINIFMKMALGMCGAFVMNILGSTTGIYEINNTGAGILASTIGAVIILTIIKLVSSK